jgi:hypothetical protein
VQPLGEIQLESQKGDTISIDICFGNNFCMSIHEIQLLSACEMSACRLNLLGFALWQVGTTSPPSLTTRPERKEQLQVSRTPSTRSSMRTTSDYLTDGPRKLWLIA